MTKHRKYTDWHRSLLDTYYKLPSTYAPSRRNFCYAGQRLLCPHHHHRGPQGDGLGGAWAGCPARGAVGLRGYANQKATFDYWVRVDGYARPRSRSARAGTASTSSGPLDFRSYGGSAPWNYSDWATTKAGAWLKANAWKYGFIMCTRRASPP